ncbi:HpcH/HpaI aldolase/citrate lyase family protein [Rhodococcus sp. NPDC003994]|uniref:HpcH/HpaI aldolase/citrate lyase family protein n=1 Tax=Rhodococcoides kroppenstedtii TaxID=293050 RepID=UPI001C9B43D0|nr:CoA ester lyase [Rhodococcus kroppenstedtii]MBY6438516.1 CoA ester lyase [Rhodococcus kroppenstedtii]
MTGGTAASVRSTGTPRRRVVLVVPASDERKVLSALRADCDEVMLDLEDAVVPAAKTDARARAVSVLATRTVAAPTVSVRINARGTDEYYDDLDAMASAHPATVMVPKVDGPDDVRDAVRRLGDAPTGVQALIETARGLDTVGEIAAAHARLQALVLGYADLGADLGRARTCSPASWLHVQDRVLIAARAAGIQAVDGPYLGVRDDAEFRVATTWTRDLGFDGTWVIHPAQIDFARATFTPSDDDVAYARRVLETMAAAAGGAVALDGRMLDEAVVVAARRTLARAGAETEGNGT